MRVGLEDAVFIEKGVLAPSNTAMVEKARRIVESLGGQIANTNLLASCSACRRGNGLKCDG